MISPTLCFSYARPLLAIIAIGASYIAAEHSQSGGAGLADLAAQFSFDRIEIKPPAGLRVLTPSDIRVNPHVEHIKSWVLAAGAAITFADLDGDGLANDICFVDPRTDSVSVQSVPGQPPRYQPIILRPPPRRRDPPFTNATGCLAADFNEDGQTDLLVYYATRPPVLFLRNGDGYISQELVADPNVSWHSGAAVVADFDGDGHLDILVANYFQDGAEIFFPDSSLPVELNDSFGNARNGGKKHFFLFESATQGSHPSVKFRHVTDVLPPEVDGGWTLALGAADLDGDLLPELYIANDFGPDRLLRNRSTPGHLAFDVLEGKRGFATPRSKVLGHDSFKGMGVDIGDLNNDGYLDIAVSNISAPFAFLEGNFVFLNTGDQEAIRQGIAPFRDMSEKLGLTRSGFSWEMRFGDFNNSGKLQILQATGFIKGDVNQYPGLHELALGNNDLTKYPQFWPFYRTPYDLSGHDPNRFWVLHPNGRYVDVGSEIFGFNKESVSRGIATADVDGDGKLDFAIANQWGSSYFFHNTCANCGDFLGLHVLLPLQPSDVLEINSGHPNRTRAARPAIGASVHVEASDGRAWTTFVDASNGHSGKRAPEIHLGLGNLATNATLRVSIAYRDVTGRRNEVAFSTDAGWHSVYLPWSPPKE